MLRLLPAFAFAAALVAAGGSAAQDTKKDKTAAGPAGVWTREAGGFELQFDFTAKDTLKIGVAKGDEGVTVTCKTTVKGGAVKAEIIKVVKKGEFPNPPPVGFEFGFKWAATGDAAELSDLTGENIDNVRPIFEGEYKKAAGKKGKKD
jgi:hypothetical protein